MHVVQQHGQGRMRMEVLKEEEQQQQQQPSGLDQKRKERRRRQNRLNQRAHRQRQAVDQGVQTRPPPSFEVRKWRLDDEDDDEIDQTEAARTLDSSSSTTQSVARGLGPTSWPVWPADVERYGSQLESAMQLTSPQADQLLHLVSFNVFRGLFYNKVLLSQLAAFEKQVDGVNTRIDLWKNFPAETTMAAPSPAIPSTLQPTDLQRTVPHATWIDFFPFPQMRESLIRRHADFSHRDMFHDMVGGLMDEVYLRNGPDHSDKSGGPRLRVLPSSRRKSQRDDRKGIILWGDSHLQSSWEFTAHFLQKWSWIFGASHEMIESTNFWRRQRGERPLNLRPIGCESC
ncbi:hypothetical protein NLU13_5055 [Sarocladium strictum]|uniref:BZIP domain-containing protein n=1 Tax=Sarocladium strictum TaxID=5046 RepID=A0AA39GMQ1_SARSR|nr:hypothetical protein NLU13_5055 [Sarocladium strictum]